MGAEEVKAYLSHLAMNKQVAASTQNVAFAALLFLYQTVLEQPFGELANVVRAKRSKHIPTVLSQKEVRSLLGYASGRNGLVLKLLYGTGMRLMEALRLRVKDIDFDYKSINIHDAKGKKGRITVLPESLIEPLRTQLKYSCSLYEQDLESGIVNVPMPTAIAKKYPEAAKTWRWQYVFASNTMSVDPRSGMIGRYHLHRKTVQRSMQKTVAAVGIEKKASCHTLRHSLLRIC